MYVAIILPMYRVSLASFIDEEFFSEPSLFHTPLLIINFTGRNITSFIITLWKKAPETFLEAINTWA